QAELTVGGVAVELVGADALLPVPLDEAGEVALPRAYRSVQPVGGGAWPGGGEELDGADPQTVEVDDAPPAVPHPHAVVEVAGGEAVEVEHGPALESHPHLSAARLDARDLAEARHEKPDAIDRALPVGDLDPEDLDRAALLGQPLWRHLGEPGVLVLGAVEVVAPERLLVASPAQPPLVGGAIDGGDPAVEEPLLGLGHRVGFHRRRGRGGDRGRCRRGGAGILAEGPIAGDDGEEDGPGGECPTHDLGSRHDRLSLRRFGTGGPPPPWPMMNPRSRTDYGVVVAAVPRRGGLVMRRSSGLMAIG